MDASRFEFAVQPPQQPSHRVSYTEKSAQRAQNDRARGLAIPFAGTARIACDAAAWQVLKTVSDSEDIPIVLLMDTGRRKAPIAHARQLAMYLAHILLGRTLTEVGQLFGRDRTTVAYACARIEDKRDEPEFDEYVIGLECLLNGGAGENAE